MSFRKTCQNLCISLILLATTGLANADTGLKAFDIPAQPLATALRQFAEQTGLQLAFETALTDGQTTPALKGNYTPDQALTQLLKNTQLRYEYLDNRTIAVSPTTKTTNTTQNPSPGTGEEGALREGEGNSLLHGGEKVGVARMRVAQNDQDSKDEDVSSETSEETSSKGIPEILVKGSRSQNVDVRRTEEDPQPYVVFDALEIERSQARSLEDFFRKRLPMNTTAQSSSQQTQLGGNISNISSINLRGLGATQTLILVDGRRAPRLVALGSGSSTSGTGPDLTQADINGIPLSSIERIEILPSTAGGIYGGGAVGGVINIIRKHDYHALDLRAGYDGTVRGGGETTRLDLSGGLSLENGRTNISFSASQAKSSPLYVGDNDLWRAGRELVNTNDPNGTITPYSTTPNIKSTGTTFNPACGCFTPPNLVLDNGTPLNSNHTFIPFGYRGVALDGNGPLLANAGRYNLELSNDSLGRYAPLLNNPLIRSVNINLRRQFTSWLDAFADFTTSENRGQVRLANAGVVTLPGTASNNPFQQSIVVFFPIAGFERPAISRARTQAMTAGMIARLPQDWTATVEYSWSRARNTRISTGAPITSAGLTALINGTLNVIGDLGALPLDLSPYSLPGPDTYSPFETVQQLASARLSGLLFDLPGGPLSLTTLAEHRIETAPRFRRQSVTAVSTGIFPSDVTYPERSQSVDSGYIELRASLVSDRNAMPFIQGLELQTSVRHDDYTTRIPAPSQFNTATPPTSIAGVTSKVRSTDYTVALRWMPVRDVSLRASYGTGFLPPSISQSVASNVFMGTTPATGILDPLRGNQQVGTAVVPYTQLSGTNPNLQPESSKSFSSGVVFTPRFLPDLRFSLDYSRIRKDDEIGTISPTTLLANETAFPDRVVRAPKLTNDPANWAGPIILYDVSLINISHSRIEAWDFQADYNLVTTRAGTFHFYTVVTQQTDLLRKLLPTSSPYNTVDFSDGPLKWRGNVGLDWTFNRWEVDWNAQYYHGYSVRLGDPTLVSTSDTNVLRQGAGRIPSQMYHDLNIRHRFGADAPSVLSDLSLSFGIQNIFDKKPPPIAATSVAASYSSYGDPRLRRYTVTLSKNFSLAK